MSKLNENWLTDGLIDFEYKKYVLLAYLQSVKTHFDDMKLYPFLSEMVWHYRNLKQVKENKKFYNQGFQKVMTGIDQEKLQLVYESIVKDDELMQEIEQITDYALARFSEGLQYGRELHETVEEKIEITPVGLTSLHNDEGYVFVYQEGIREYPVYQYQIRKFEIGEDPYCGIHTTFITQFTWSIGNTFESAKSRLIKEHKLLPNPATFLVRSMMAYPLEETILPIAKRLLIKYVHSEQGI